MCLGKVGQHKQQNMNSSYFRLQDYRWLCSSVHSAFQVLLTSSVFAERMKMTVEWSCVSSSSNRKVCAAECKAAIHHVSNEKKTKKMDSHKTASTGNRNCFWSIVRLIYQNTSEYITGSVLLMIWVVALPFFHCLLRRALKIMCACLWIRVCESQACGGQRHCIYCGRSYKQ